jgi:hypothetical protein
VRRQCIYVRWAEGEFQCHSVTPDRRARLCKWNRTEVLDTGQLMKMLSKCFAVNLGDHQVVLGVYHSVKKTRAWAVRQSRWVTF